MKQITLTLLCLLSCYICHARDKEIKIRKAATVELVKMLLPDGSVVATQHDLPYDIFSWKHDSARREIIVLLKQKGGTSMTRGYLAIYDLTTESFRWEMPVNVFDVFTSGNHVLLTSSTATSCYNRANGDLLWKTENIRIRHVDTVSQIGISSLGKGLDLNTGKIIWTKKLKDSDYWTDFTTLNDSMLACLSNGLHIVNTRTGNVIDIEGQTVKVDANNNYNTAIALGIVGGVLGGMAGGGMGITIMVPLQGDRPPTAKTAKTSRMVIEGNKLYFAMLDRIVCVDFVRGGLNWQNPLPSRSPSRSYLYLLDGRIALVNGGLKGSPSAIGAPTGLPYMCVYNKVSGVPVYEENLSLNYGTLYDKKLHGDTLTFIYSKTLCKRDITHNREIVCKRNAKSLNFYESFVDKNSVYVAQQDAGLTNLNKVYPDISELIIDNMKMLIVLGNNYDQLAKLDTKKLGFKVAEEGAFSIVNNGGRKYILKDEMAVVQVDSRDNGLLTGGKYYQFDDDRMIVVDLSSVK